MTVPSQPSRSGPDHPPAPPPAAAPGVPVMPPGVPVMPPGVPVVPSGVPAGEPGSRVIGTAVAAPAAAAPAVAAPAAAPSTAPPGGGAPGGSYPGGPGPRQQWHARRHHGLPRLRLGRHAAPAGALDELQVRRESFGLRLGRAHTGEPVIVRLFRPGPTWVTLVGGRSAAALLTFRALRFGSRAVVSTPAAAGWIELGRRATGRTDRMAVRAPGEEVTAPASADVPVLRVDLTGRLAGDDLPDWTTRLSVVPAVAVAVHPGAGDLTAADLVLAERLPPAAVATLAPLLGLSPPVQQGLASLPDGALAVLTRAGTRYAWTEPTAAEREAVFRNQG